MDGKDSWFAALDATDASLGAQLELGMVSWCLA